MSPGTLMNMNATGLGLFAMRNVGSKELKWVSAVLNVFINLVVNWSKSLTLLFLTQSPANNNLTGIIISELSSLPFLFGLDLSSNKLFGEIPESLGNLETLTLIDISGNHLVSTIPESFFTSTSLQYLYLSKNKLSGTIPSALGTNEAIKELWLHDNQLTGPIPDSFISTTSLGKSVVCLV